MIKSWESKASEQLNWASKLSENANDDKGPIDFHDAYIM
jgi:hypothetical protein